MEEGKFIYKRRPFAKLLSYAIVFFKVGKGGFAHLNDLQKSHAKIYIFAI